MLHQCIPHHFSEYFRLLVIGELLWREAPLHFLAEHVEFGERRPFGPRAQQFLAVQGDPDAAIFGGVKKEFSWQERKFHAKLSFLRSTMADS